jgi:hypothetical protein
VPPTVRGPSTGCTISYSSTRGNVSRGVGMASYGVDAAFMQLELHERGNHVVSPGGRGHRAGARETESDGWC